jgi:hypothetical protein
MLNYQKWHPFKPTRNSLCHRQSARNSEAGALCTRAVRKVSSHFEYLENRSRCLDVTWQPIRGDITVHRWTVTLPRGLVSRQWDAVDWACVLCDRRIHKPPPFQQLFKLWEKPEVAGRQIWAVGGLKWCFAKKACTRAVELAGALSWWRWSARSVIVNATVTQYTNSVNGVSLPTD